ncbi:MAG TPA: ABC transporter ATP-binding protein [Chthonomonadaceae bacterium]|nr:ABC transporter ATP-binding protein [Chthonomonadaceae bacterium]
MIVLEHASRWYGQVIGINDVSCRIMPGITALLGPNGAGKSTLIKLITGQLRPSTGTVTVLGEAPFANPRVFRRLGYCPELERGCDDMTGRYFVTLLAHMGGLPSASIPQRVSEVIEFVGMTENADRKIGGYSKGMRQRIKIAQGVVHDPDVLVLDEPLNGLDPIGRREVTGLLTGLADKGKCVVVSSHILYEVEHLTRNILLMNHGRLLAQGDIYTIRSLIDAHPHRIAIRSKHARALAIHLLNLPYVLSARLDAPDATQVEVETRSPDTFYSQFPDMVLEHGFDITSFESPDNNLESVFKYLVNESGTKATQ